MTVYSLVFRGLSWEVRSAKDCPLTTTNSAFFEPAIFIHTAGTLTALLLINLLRPIAAIHSTSHLLCDQNKVHYIEIQMLPWHRGSSMLAAVLHHVQQNSNYMLCTWQTSPARRVRAAFTICKASLFPCIAEVSITALKISERHNMQPGGP